MTFLKLPVTLSGSTNPRLYPALGTPTPTWRWDGLDLPASGAVPAWAAGGSTLALQSGTAPTVATTGGVKYVAWAGAQGALGLTAMGNDAIKSLLMVVRMKASPPAGGLFNGGAILLNANATTVTMFHAGQTGSNPTAASAMNTWQVVVATVPAGIPAAGSKLWVNAAVSAQSSNTTSTSKISQLLIGGGTTNMDVAGVAAWNYQLSDAQAAGAYAAVKESYAGLGWS